MCPTFRLRPLGREMPAMARLRRCPRAPRGKRGGTRGWTACASIATLEPLEPSPSRRRPWCPPERVLQPPPSPFALSLRRPFDPGPPPTSPWQLLGTPFGRRGSGRRGPPRPSQCWTDPELRLADGGGARPPLSALAQTPSSRPGERRSRRCGVARPAGGGRGWKGSDWARRGRRRRERAAMVRAWLRHGALLSRTVRGAVPARPPPSHDPEAGVM
jgi:hypothetical protein